MSIEEKVGQMTQLSIDDFVVHGEDKLIPEKLQTVWNEYKIGSILNYWDNTPHSKETWNRFMKELHSYIQKNPLQIPLLYGIDSMHGANYVFNFTMFPNEIGMGATFNPPLQKILSELSAYETRASSVPWTFSPDVDLALDPRWPRFWEGFGEDPSLISQMGVASVQGFQGDNPNEIDEFHVGACAKHYLGYSNPRTGQDRGDAVISEYFLRENYLPGFQAVIKSEISTVMIS
jgi:beta-glucosidase